MRKLIVSSLVSLDGIHGDPQSWPGITSTNRPRRHRSRCARHPHTGAKDTGQLACTP